MLFRSYLASSLACIVMHWGVWVDNGYVDLFEILSETFDMDSHLQKL